METSFVSQDDIIIAWATSVSLAQLGARLEAYVRTRATITTFRLAARDTTLAACKNLPEEIKSMIASEVRNIVFEKKMEKWTQITECLANTCTILSHIPRAELKSMQEKLSEDYDDEEWIHEDLIEEFEERADEEHEKIVRLFGAELSNLNSSSKFSKCAQIFTREFGIRPYFMMSKSYGYNENIENFEIDNIKSQAFLTLPVFVGPISSEPAPDRVSISVCKTMNPSALAGLSEAQVQQFHIALSTLNLHPYDPDEKVGKVEEWPQLMMLGNGEFKACYSGYW